MSESDEYLRILEGLRELQMDETEFQIITALRWYGSLNLKKISKLIQRPESTTLRYIRKMRDKKKIEFDSETSEKNWGNFYKLSKRVSNLYENYMKLVDERVERITFDMKDLDKMSDAELDKYVLNEIVNPGKLAEIPATRAYFHFVANLQRLMVNETMDGIEQLAEMAEKEGYEEVKNKIILPPIDVSTYVNALKISNFRHILRINEVIFEFDRKLQALGKEIIDEMDKAGIPEEDRNTQFVNIFTGSLDLDVKFKE
jgi:hypothetical protein